MVENWVIITAKKQSRIWIEYSEWWIAVELLSIFKNAMIRKLKYDVCGSYLSILLCLKFWILKSHPSGTLRKAIVQEIVFFKDTWSLQQSQRWSRGFLHQVINVPRLSAQTLDSVHRKQKEGTGCCEGKDNRCDVELIGSGRNSWTVKAFLLTLQTSSE